MIAPVECTKITLQIPNKTTQKAFELFKEIGISYYYSQQSRIAALKEKEAFLIWPAKIELFEYSAEIIKFFAPKQLQKKLIAKITQVLNLHIKGNGSVYGESVELFYDNSVDLINEFSIKQTLIECTVLMEDGLWAISCVLPRGKADKIVQAALGMGIGIPSITFGINHDFKDQFGILRIVVLAEKEIVNLVVHKTNVDDIMDKLITIGELDAPGNGFIYDYPLGPGVINSKMLYGKQRHLASMEQVISAIDLINKSSNWRMHESTTTNIKRNMLKDFCAIILHCDPNQTPDLTATSPQIAISGKTAGLVKLRNTLNDSKAVLQEATTIITEFDYLEDILDKLESEGIFANQGIVELKSIDEAFTYA
jgi:nitrogen regulatory protein PII